MRQLRILTFLFFLVTTHYGHASPIHVDVKGTIATAFSTGPSPISHGAKVTGWYELNWDKAKYEGEDLHSTIYSGILTYNFTVAGLTLRGLNPNILYYSSTSNISPNSENMQFQDLYPELFSIGNFPIIEDLYFGISVLNGIRKTHFTYDSVPDFNNNNYVYSGYCELEEVNITSLSEPCSFIIFILGFFSIALMRIKRN